VRPARASSHSTTARHPARTPTPRAFPRARSVFGAQPPASVRRPLAGHRRRQPRAIAPAS